MSSANREMFPRLAFSGWSMMPYTLFWLTEAQGLYLDWEDDDVEAVGSAIGERPSWALQVDVSGRIPGHGEVRRFLAGASLLRAVVYSLAVLVCAVIIAVLKNLLAGH